MQGKLTDTAAFEAVCALRWPRDTLTFIYTSMNLPGCIKARARSRSRLH
jgi:hypothetical protein